MLSLYKKQCLAIIEDYRHAGGSWPAKKTEIAEWALANKRWQPSREDIRHMCAEAMAATMSEEQRIDETTGLSARAKVPAKTTRDGEQGTFWADTRDAPAAFMHLSVAQWRRGMVAGCHMWSKVTRVFNAHHESSEQIDLSLDFTKDVRELDQPKTAREAKAASSFAVERSRQPEKPPLVPADAYEPPESFSPFVASVRPTRRSRNLSLVADAPPPERP